MPKEQIFQACLKKSTLTSISKEMLAEKKSLFKNELED